MSQSSDASRRTPSYVKSHIPIQALCRHYGLEATQLAPSGVVGEFHDMAVAEDVDIYYPPTHVLAVTQSDIPTNPLMIPINSAQFQNAMRYELTFPPPPESLTPRTVDTHTDPVISLPVVPLAVPHPNSLSLVLLYAMDLERDMNHLSMALLPGSVVGEFPNAAAMATVLSAIPSERFDQIYRHNQGIWKNVLALDVINARLVDLFEIGWNVTVEARRIRNRASRPL